MTNPTLEYTILNVDDHDAGRYAKSRILQLAGYRVVEAATGADALRLIREAKPQLILLDVKLPDVDGTQLCRTIKSDPLSAQIMVLQISAVHTTRADRIHGLECGADTYLIEPVQADELLATVNALLRLYDRERENRQLVAQLRNADRQKDDFLAALAHELRNPLGVVSNAFDILPETQTPEPVSQELRDIIGRQIGLMSRLVDDLLDISRIARGQIGLAREPCDFAAIARQTVDDYRAILESNGLELTLDVPSHPVWVVGDCTRLAQSISNLLQNAGKFTSAGDTVTVKLVDNPDEHCAVLSVRDTGIGMESDFLARIFEPFSQFDPGVGRKGGLGIGLSLVKGLIELHGGEVHARSEGPGHGSEITIRLPTQKFADSGDPAPKSTIAGADAPACYRILVIDDNSLAARTLQIFLADKGHQVELAVTGPQGLEKARRYLPQVVLCDIGLPGLDGYSVARQLRQEQGSNKMFLVAVSGYGQEEDQERAKSAGFDAYLVKPISLKDLEKLLAELNGR
ncbi:MAG TPA: response regulator [Candidatus Binatia bacterium]|nr:response regulator [Candidatus Binatia bacterium]